MELHILPLAWALIIGFCIVMYVVLDGFTLGTGMLLPFLDSDERDIAMSAILPTWDGNQTWLVLGSAALYGAFPVAFSLLLPAFYLPILLMGIALLFRGITFEFRLKSKDNKHRWDRVFAGASYVITLIQGVILGSYIQGFTLNETGTVILTDNLISWFCLFAGISLIVGYMLLGSTRLILKTENGIRDKMYRTSKFLAFFVAVCAVVVSIWTPFVDPLVAQKWFDISLWPYLVPLPAVNGLAFIALVLGLERKNDFVPYWASVVLFLCPYIGFIISIYPYIIPYHITYWQAAAPNNSLAFTIVGALIMLPVLLVYTGYSYHVFRGKVKNVLHY